MSPSSGITHHGRGPTPASGHSFRGGTETAKEPLRGLKALWDTAPARHTKALRGTEKQKGEEARLYGDTWPRAFLLARTSSCANSCYSPRIPPLSAPFRAAITISG